MALVVILRNDRTGPDHASNYDVKVYVNSEVIAEERVTGHPRAEGWRALIRRLGEGPQT